MKIKKEEFGGEEMKAQIARRILKKDGLSKRGSRAQEGKSFDLQAACKKKSKELFEELEAIALSDANTLIKPMLKLGAIRELLDRGHGRPKETIENKGGPRIIEIVHASNAQSQGQDGTFKPVITAGVGNDSSQELKRAEN